MGKQGLSFARAEGGAAAVEFALVATPFIAMLFAAMQIFLIFFSQQVLETAAEEGGRLILTGNAQLSGMSQAAFKTAICNKMSALLDCSKLMVDVQTAATFANADLTSPTVTYDSQGNPTNTWAYNPGNAGSIVVMRLLYLWPVFNLPGLTLGNTGGSTSQRLLMATAVFKTEAY